MDDNSFSQGLWQEMPLEPFDYTAWIERLRNASSEEQYDAATRYMRGILGMAQSRPEFLQGTVIRDIQDLNGIEIPEGQMAILHSGYGIEGVFTEIAILRAKIFYLRGFNAYNGEKFSVSLHTINPENHS